MTDQAEHAAETPAPALRLRRLKINRWRNVLPGTELRFGDGIHALLGKNGTGKTTLLRLISRCVRGDFRGLESDSFDIHYELEPGPYHLAVSISNRLGTSAREDGLELRLAVPIQAAAAGTPSAIQFRLEFRGLAILPTVILGTEKELSVNGRPESRLETSPLAPGFFILAALIGSLNHQVEDSSSEEKGNFAWQKPWIEMISHLQSAKWSFRFDEADLMLRALEGSKKSGPDNIPPLRVHLTAASQPSSDGGDWFPSELQVFLASRGLSHSRPTNGIEATHESLPLLKVFSLLAGFDSTRMTLAFQSKLKLLGRDVYRFGGARFFIDLRDGETIPHDDLSFGQRRLLAFLYYCACNPQILIVDELTNGLHHEWIAHCMDELAKRQSFVATQHPLLLDYLPIESAKDAETAFLQCRLVEQDGKQYMTWRNTSTEEAERFWKSYGSGVQFISEILRTDGLW